MKKVNSDNKRRTTNGCTCGKDLSVSCAATSPKRRGNRRGFTIVELVVSLAIILLVSGAAIMLVSTQVKVDLQAAQTIDATNVAENAIECFRYAVNVPGNDTKDEVVATFEAAFNKTGYELNNPEGKYEINKHGAVITIEITEDTAKGTHTINIVATVGNNKEIINESYTK